MSEAERRLQAEAYLQTALHQQMAMLERVLAAVGAGEWETVLLAYHPKVEGAHILVLTDGATVEQTRRILAPLKEPKHDR